MNNLLLFFNSIIAVSAELEYRLASILQIDTFPKKHLLLKEGQVAHYIYFVEKGFVRSYYLKEGKKITSWFMKENDVVISVNSFYKQIPSYEYMETVEESVLNYISYEELQKLFQDFPEFNIIGRVLTEKYYMLSEERLYSTRKQKAEDRYKFLLKYHPQIVQRAPLGSIASYLGISMETLSRIRGKI